MSEWWTESELEDGQYIALVVLGTISSTLSLMGSSCIIYMTHKDLANKVLNRLLFALSLSDLFGSTSFLLSPFLVPSYLGLPGSSGNHQSCAAVGFVWSTTASMVSFFNCYISIYYLLVIRWSFHEWDFAVAWEIAGYGTAILISLAINVAALVTQSINPIEILNGLCSYAAIPWGCEEEDCTRSSQPIVDILVYTMCTVQLVVSILGFACTILIWKWISSAMRRTNRHRVQGDNNERSEEQLRQVFTQAVLYSLAYFNTFFWPFVGMCFDIFVPADKYDAKKNDIGVYVLAVLCCICWPLQGFLNFFIFARPRAQQWAQAEPEKSSFWIYSHVIQSKQPTRPQRSIT